jgi:hypothetical protein
MHQRLSILRIALIITATVFFVANGLKAQKIVIKTENGVPAVYNPKEPVRIKGEPTKVTLKHELTIGQESGDADHVFSGLQMFVVDDHERIYVLDWKDAKVKVFDSHGNHLCSFGTKGQGPGEINQPIRIIDVPGGGVAVLDAGSKLIFFSPEGRVLKEVPLGKYSTLRRYLIDSDGCIYGHVWSFDETMATAKFMKFSPVLEPLITLASFEQKIPRRVFRPYSEEYFVNLTADENLLWAVHSDYKLTILDKEGKILRKIIKDYDPVKITTADRDELIKTNFGDRGIPANVTVDIPKYYPAIHHVLRGGDGRFVVCTYDYTQGKDGRLIRHDVFDSQGQYIARFYHPQTETTFSILNDKLYTRVEESAGGTEKVSIYRLIWE